MGKDKKKKKVKQSSAGDLYQPSPILDDFSTNSEGRPPKLDKKYYEKELALLQVELVKMQYWVKHVGYRMIMLFEGVMLQVREAPSNASQNLSTPGVVTSLPLAPLQTSRKPNGIFSGT